MAYEDAELIVVNKAAGMVVHLSAGHYSGTLVNALLHHCGLPGVQLQPQPGSDSDPKSGGPDAQPSHASSLWNEADEGEDEGEETSGTGSEGEGSSGAGVAGGGEVEQSDPVGTASSGGSSSSVVTPSRSDVLPVQRGFTDSKPSLPGTLLGKQEAHGQKQQLQLRLLGLRPGIVHRLDKGTTGLMVVAKTEPALRHLGAQFKARTVRSVDLWVTTVEPKMCPPADGSL